MNMLFNIIKLNKLEITIIYAIYSCNVRQSRTIRLISKKY